MSLRNMLLFMIGLLGISTISLSVYNDIEANTEKTRAVIVDNFSKINKNLFISLARTRIERGYAMFGLSAEPANNRDHRRISQETRLVLDDSMQIAVNGLKYSDQQNLASLGSDIENLFKDWQRLRPEVDIALDQPLVARDKMLRDRWNKLGDQLIAKIDATSLTMDTEIQALEPSLGVLLNMRSNVWIARMTSGRVGAILNSMIVEDRLATQSEILELRDAEARSEQVWSIVGRTITTSNASVSVKDAYAKGNSLYFGGPFRDQRKTAIAAVSEGKKVPFTLADWDPGILKGQASIVDVALAVMDTAANKAQSQAASARNKFLVCSIIAGLAFLLTIFAGWMIQKKVINGVMKLCASMQRLAGGYLDTTVPDTHRRDELGEMAAAVQVFKDNLIRTKALEEETALARASVEEQRKAGMRQMADAFEGAVGGIVGQVSAAATELQATAQQMTSTASETAAQSTTVAVAADQAASNVETVAAAAEQLGSSVQEISRQVAGSASLAQTAVAEAAQTAHLVQELSGAVSKIGDVVAMISSIAGQTNLLALNATIEAARAGEAGRGFAVVAAEVKALASQTARATDEISSQISQIQGATGQAVGAISGIGARIREISSVAASIAAAVEQQGAATQEIVRNVAQAATGTSEVTGNIAGVAGAAEETGVAAGQVLASASELSRHSEHLSAEVDRFLATVRAA